ncbi:MAG: AAA family ATPase [Treponema sp.]|nr:AAA family ATPase [Treponema sp.]
MEIKNEVEKRFEEVLDDLNIQGIFILDEKVFYTHDKQIISNRKPSRKVIDYCKKNNYFLIRLNDEGYLYSADREVPVLIKHCLKCNKFFLEKKNPKRHDQCPYCQSNKIKLLSNNGKIPAWYGKKASYIIDPKNIKNSSFDSDISDRISEIINKLSGKAKYIILDEEKINKIHNLSEVYPNMKEVIDYIEICAKTSEYKESKQFSFKPIVLVGSPGCGKTSFVRELTKIILGKTAMKIDLGNSVSALTLSGSASNYSHSKHGLIIESMFAENENDRPLKNPIIHFDELDKINMEEADSIGKVFYGILEKNTAKNFFDNFLATNVDASGINYIFTANSLENIPAPIISRLKVFKIRDYTKEELKTDVLDSFYNNWLINNEMDASHLPKKLSNYIKEMILEISGNDTRSIEDAINLVFNQTITEDKESNAKIALFSPEEICDGWKKYAGHKAFSKEAWKLPYKFGHRDNAKDFLEKLTNLS